MLLSEEKKNLIGKKFNKLTILDFSHRKNKNIYWNVQCDCSNKTIKKVRDSHLRTGAIKSCGCLLWAADRRIKMIGKKFNHWTIVGHHHDRKSVPFFLCKCDCNNKETFVISYPSLKNNVSKSCPECRVWKKGQPIEDIFLRDYCKRASDRGKLFLLSKKVFLKLIKQNCYHCGISPYQIFKVNNRELIFNGIDRLNNKLNYTKYNCVASCGKCNKNKRNWTPEEFNEWLLRATVNKIITGQVILSNEMITRLKEKF